MEVEVDKMLDGVMKRVTAELPSDRDCEGRPAPIRVSRKQLAQAITLAIGEAVPHIMKLTLLYAHELEKENKT
jgi:hypothetical protein